MARVGADPGSPPDKSPDKSQPACPSVARHHHADTIEGSKWLADQDLAWTLVEQVVVRIHELENELGCFFDRNPDGTVHQKRTIGMLRERHAALIAAAVTGQNDVGRQANQQGAPHASAALS